MLSRKGISFNISTQKLAGFEWFLEKHGEKIVVVVLSIISVVSFYVYWKNGLGLAYNDARSHLDIARRVVEGLKPGIAQLGSVWLPLPHILMIPTIWNDFMWHSGLAGAIVSMIAFVTTGWTVYKYLKEVNVALLGRFIGVIVFVANINVLYLQATAMTELLVLATMTLGVYYLMLWHKDENLLNLILSAAFVMLATTTRYDGWFLLAWASALVVIEGYREGGYKKAEGIYIFFGTLAGLGIVLWLLWNLIIFRDPFYFAFGPYSAKAQQDQLDVAGVLQTKDNILLSLKFYFYAWVYNSGLLNVIIGTIGALVFVLDKKVNQKIRIASTALMAPFFFNVLALYLGHSVLFIQGLSGDTWFNVRYGIMLAPSLAIFIGYLINKLPRMRWQLIGLLFFVTFFSFTSQDAVTIDDARVGSSQKNVTEVSGWLAEHAANEEGFVLISAASHDAIIFSSGLPMKKFIHEGTGLYWESATSIPDRWAKWIIMRTNDNNDSTFRLVSKTPWEDKYVLKGHFPFADIYELKEEYWDTVNTNPVLKRQR